MGSIGCSSGSLGLTVYENRIIGIFWRDIACDKRISSVACSCSRIAIIAGDMVGDRQLGIGGDVFFCDYVTTVSALLYCTIRKIESRIVHKP